ncbi:uncharacterized protein TM35_000271050 [Trypanosoma theileri]|uniref:Leucine-rich repeat-containing protein 51 n=1 Tax=Trypanosoma theileri TaxID=67003 RepID=A0A1X0NP85_9TRYP|nr:uncharacterized protein TM35_000271050 [Trypanosoma theileri]ORC86515.1 hypothetical protein TM35_000271050 [Trypanosoma theileri]
MEFEQLEIGKKCLTTAISRQDVGDYYDLLHPNVLLVSHFKYPPPPPVVADTIPLLARALRHTENTEKNSSKTHKTKSRSKTKSRTTSPTRPLAATTASTATTMNTNTTRTGAVTATGISMRGQERGGGRGKTTTTTTQQKQQQESNEEEKGESCEVDIVEGPLLTTERFYAILHWMNKGKFIAESSVEMEARKVILQDSEVLPPPPAPKNEAERIAQLGRQYTDRNQRLSRLIVTFGRELLLFRDECYFEDGLIVTIHRFMLTTQEMLALVGLVGYDQQPQTQKRVASMLEERRRFYNTERANRVDATAEHATLPVLDYTFCAVAEPLQLLVQNPTAGRAHVSRIPQPLVDPHIAQGVFLNQQSDPTRVQKDQRVIVKARNKQGEEEVYEFVESSKSRYGFLHDRSGNTENALETLASKLETTYATTSVRLTGCGMTSTEKLVPVLRRLVVNAIMTIRALDLSNNNITTLPDLSLLPLQRLQLHQNRIADWAQIENRVCPLPILYAVTLHGNPIAENDPHYWQSALARLMRNPRRAVPLRQLDFVTLTGQDYGMAGAYELFETGDPKLLEASRGKHPGTNGRVF